MVTLWPRSWAFALASSPTPLRGLRLCLRAFCDVELNVEMSQSARYRRGMLAENTIVAGAMVWLDVREGKLSLVKATDSTTFCIVEYRIADQNVMLDLFEYVQRYESRFRFVKIR